MERLQGALTLDKTGAIFVTNWGKLTPNAPFQAILKRYWRSGDTTKGDQAKVDLGANLQTHSAPALIRANVPPSKANPVGLALGTSNGIALFYADSTTLLQVGGYLLFDDPASPYSAVTVAGDGTVLFVTQNRIYALEVNLDDTSAHVFVKWFHPTLPYLGGREATLAGDGTIYVAGGSLLALTPQGKKLWESADLELIGNPVIGKSGDIYVLGKHGRIYSFSPGGSQNWVADDAYLPSTTLTSYTRLAVATIDQQQFLILVHSGNDKVYAIETTSRAVVSAQLPSAPIERPTVTQSGLVLIGLNNTVVRWTIGSPNTPAYELDPASTLLSPPLLGAGDRLVVLTGVTNASKLQIYKSVSN